MTIDLITEFLTAHRSEVVRVRVDRETAIGFRGHSDCSLSKTVLLFGLTSTFFPLQPGNVTFSVARGTCEAASSGV